MKKNVLISGSNGAMGLKLMELIKVNFKDELEVVAGFDKESKKRDGIFIYSDLNEIKEKIDVIIDFSTPKATIIALDYAKKKKIPIVIATTGFSKEEEEMILESSKYTAIFKSANMSYGINVMKDIVAKTSKVMFGADIEIIEAHHNRKKDSPSGTAKLLADAINIANDGKYTYNLYKSSELKEREKNEIGFASIRAGNIIGEHTVIFATEHEIIEITHKAQDRTLFAEGAIKAAIYILNQTPGIYEMIDLS